MSPGEISETIKNEAALAGFDQCGIAPAVPLNDEKALLLKWLAGGFNSGMRYLERGVEKRTDPSLFFEKAKSVVMVSLNYYTDTYNAGPGDPVISRYALGADYHKVLNVRLDAMLNSLKAKFPGLEGRPFADTSPVMEKALAVKAGLGSQGKNTLLITKTGGSYYFLGGLIINLVAAYDSPAMADPCGNCRICIDACPTAALSDQGFLDAGRCISYLTVEHRGKFEGDAPSNFKGRVFGCDICQEVCPHNAAHKPHHVNEFLPRPDLLSITPDEWDNLTPERFDSLFRNSAVYRCGYSGFMRNMNHARSGE